MSTYGVAQEQVGLKVMPLYWHSLTIVEETDIWRTLQQLGGPLHHSGVYAFDGSHDSRPTGGILYIGQCGINDEEPDQPLMHRIRKSFARFGTSNGQGCTLYSDVYHLTIRWAYVEPPRVQHAEHLLIVSHAPSFNGQLVRTDITDPEGANLVLLNGGAKGRLLPVLAGGYFYRDFWPKSVG